jgi:hypothetical protein
MITYEQDRRVQVDTFNTFTLRHNYCEIIPGTRPADIPRWVEVWQGDTLIQRFDGAGAMQEALAYIGWPRGNEEITHVKDLLQ